MALATALLLAPAAAGKTFVVNKRGDHPPNGCTKKDCTLREAVIRANNRPGADRIELPSRKPYRLGIPFDADAPDPSPLSGDLNVLGPLTVAHPGGGRATIDARRKDRVFENRARLKLRKLVLRRGGRPEESAGGAILALANLKLIRSKIVGSTALSAGGIAAFDSANLTLRRSRVARNTAAGEGGGVHFAGNRLRVVASTIARNTTGCTGLCLAVPWIGGGIYTEGASALISRSTIVGNSARQDGGGIFNAGALAVVNSTLAKNRVHASGGGLYAAPGTLARLNAVTIARNRADANNTGPPDFGGGIWTQGGADVVEIRNSLVALNRTTNGTIQECDAPAPVGIESLGGNLITTAAGGCGFFDHPQDLVAPKPRIGKLSRNGGPTRTIALRRKSPAIGQADGPGRVKRDQRGVRRKNPDVGAYERR